MNKSSTEEKKKTQQKELDDAVKRAVEMIDGLPSKVETIVLVGSLAIRIACDETTNTETLYKLKFKMQELLKVLEAAQKHAFADLESIQERISKVAA